MKLSHMPRACLVAMESLSLMRAVQARTPAAPALPTAE